MGNQQLEKINLFFIKELKKREVEVTLTTNGSLFTKKDLDCLKEIGIDGINFSIDTLDLREYFYNKIKNEMDHWDMSDAYSITFFLYSNEAYAYKEYSNVCEFSISLNNETFFKS